MKKVMIIALILAGLLLIPAVSAEVLYDEEIDDYVFTGESYKIGAGGNHLFGTNKVDKIVFKDISEYNSLSYITIDIVPTEFTTAYPDGKHHLTYWYTSNPSVTYPLTASITTTYNLLGKRENTRIQLFFPEWDIGSLTGSQTIEFSNSLYNCTAYVPGKPAANNNVYVVTGDYPSHTFTISSGKWTKNHITISDNGYDYTINLQRVYGNQHFKSDLVAKLGETIRYSESGSDDLELKFIHSEIDLVELSTLSKTRLYPLGDTSVEPTPTLRTGTVTMTDNNGTTISGFDVRAVNHYTGEEYTVSTETDIAVITLPMDRTIEIRNPQTGVYETAPIGYYRFYGQAPGYKMLHEDGIQVSVMPEKYGSYQLCDIRVTSETGYLTGNHQFQIRSRSDNSILQSGTISAKSATTGEWYNTTVSGGIATLILPYDTSNVVSQYAGNYYIYATSPGYEENNYGTQIVVMPHTVSEIHTVHLTPIGGVPTPGNVTLRIQAFSETGTGIPNAEIFIAGVLGAGKDVWDTYTASSTGYLTVSVPGNSTYDIVASGLGYYDSARRITVYTDDPPLIEIKLYLSGAPTVEPTTRPTGWVTPTPTQTSPIPEDNIIGMSVKGLAKGFGIDYDTALLMFGLMIIFGAGGIVMNSVKGGAMEFIAGSIVGTFVAFALGLIPIWIFIIIAVVFGAYVLRVFVQGGQ